MPDGQGEQPVTIGDLTLDRRRWEASARGRPLHLTRTEFSLLLLMAQDPGRAFSRDELLDAVWGTGYMAGSNVVDQAMAGLRRKLGDDPRHPTFIDTVTGVGYRLRAAAPGKRRGRTRFPRWLAGIALALAVAAIGATISVLLLTSDSAESEGRQEIVRFHATAHLKSPGEVTGADCSQDLVVSGAESVSDVTGDLVGQFEAMSTTRLYHNTGCLSGISESSTVFTDEDGDTLEVMGEAPVITYRLPDVPDTAVNHQSVSMTITGGSGKYAGVRGEGACTTLSLSELAGDELSASSESDCEWTLRFPEDGESPPRTDGPALDLSASPARLSLFGDEHGVPSQGRFLAVLRNGGDEPLEEAVLSLPSPQGATIQARASCGHLSDGMCLEADQRAPPRGSRSWNLGTIAAGTERRFEFTLQLLDAGSDEIRVRLELDAEGLAQPLASREIVIEVIR